MAVMLDSQPSTDEVHAAYRPLIFKFVASGTSVVDVVQVTAEVEINGEIVADLRSTVVRDRVPPVLPVFPVYWIDVSKIVQDYLSENFNVLGSGGGFVDSNCFALVRVRGYEWTDDGTGSIVKNGTGVTSNYIGVINATIQHEEVQNLISYMGDNTINPDTQKLLTKAPIWQEICENQNAFLPFWGDTILAYRVRTYDKDGVLLESGAKEMPAITSTSGYGKDNIRRSIGVGTAQILNTTWDLGGITTLDNVAYYKVDFGQINSFSGSPGFGYYTDVDERCYAVRRGCCDYMRLHFLNSLGGIDQVNLYKDDDGGVLRVKETNEFELTLDEDFGDQDRQSNILSLRGQMEYGLEKMNISEEEWEWLQDLFDSPQVMAEIDGRYVPVYLKGAKYAQLEDKMYYVEVKVYKSNYRSRQRN